MIPGTFIQGLKRVANSPKVHAAIPTLAGTWFAVHYAATDMTPNARAALWVAFVGAVTVTLRELINSWTEENVATIQNQSPAPSPLNSETQQPHPAAPTEIHVPPRTVLPGK
jgi:hypothetical protein